LSADRSEDRIYGVLRRPVDLLVDLVLEWRPDGRLVCIVGFDAHTRAAG